MTSTTTTTTTKLRYRPNRRLGGSQRRDGSKREENQNGTAKRVTSECSEQEETVKDSEGGSTINLWNYK